jgi:hypothetical protein
MSAQQGKEFVARTLNFRRRAAAVESDDLQQGRFELFPSLGVVAVQQSCVSLPAGGDLGCRVGKCTYFVTFRRLLFSVTRCFPK